MKKMIFYCMVIFPFQITLLSAQTQKSFLDNLSADDKQSIEALALYPEDVRMAILHVAQYPSLLAKTKRLQDISMERFQTLLTGVPQKTQEAIWDLTRYNGLVDRLARINQENHSIEDVLKEYPSIIHQRARQLFNSEPDLIEDIAELNALSLTLESEIYQDESPDLQASLRLLLANPDVLTILLEEIELTILVGDLYRNNPDWVLRKADSLHHELARQNAQELTDWRATIEQDPQATQELYASMSEYQETYPYDDLYAENTQKDIDVNLGADQIIREIPIYYYYPYSFWYGYPYWYDYPRWRVFPYWYDWGLFPTYQRHSIVISLPGYHVMMWYFHRPQHHVRYKHLSTKFIDHYHGHRAYGGSITSGVKSWQRANSSIITDDFLANSDKLTDNLRKYGAMESERILYNQKHPDRWLNSEEYAVKRKEKFSDLVPTRIIRNQPKAPIITKRPAIQSEPSKENKRVAAARSKELIRKIDKAKEYHQNQWTKKAPAKTADPAQSPRQKTVKPQPQKTKKNTAPNKSTDKR